MDVEIQINNSPNANARFLTWSPTRCRTRITNPAGAQGQGAIFTDHGHMIHIIRKVMLRVGAYTDYLILKLH